MQSGCVWLHINTLSRVTLFCQILYYKNKGFTYSYWHIRLSQLFLKEIISITSCTSPPQGCNLYSSVPSLLFIPSQLNIKKIRKLRNTNTKLHESWESVESQGSLHHGCHTRLFLIHSSQLLYATSTTQQVFFLCPAEVSIFHLILP